MDLHAGPSGPRKGSRPHARSRPRCSGEGGRTELSPDRALLRSGLPASPAPAPLFRGSRGRAREAARGGGGDAALPRPAPPSFCTSDPGRGPRRDPARPLQAARAAGVPARGPGPDSLSWTKLRSGSSELSSRPCLWSFPAPLCIVQF